METCGRDSTAFSLVDHLLQRDGIPVTVGGRRFWDLNDPWVVEYLADRVIGLLERGGFGYLKVDYNETLGIGCDHPDSLGEGLRRQVVGSQKFFQKIRDRLPDLVIENCASGGHRLEPSMLALTAMSSFSDAHEAVEIPIIAANLHRLMLPRQSQIWAVLRATQSDQRLAYSLAATFLGRMCLSGGIEELSAAQWEIVARAMALYRKAAPIIKHGTSRSSGALGASWRHPVGWQAVRRVSADGCRILVVLHTFADAPSEVEIPLPPGPWAIESVFPDTTAECGDALHIRNLADFHGKVILLGKCTVHSPALA
jgi:alpha-galactosidase